MPLPESPLLEGGKPFLNSQIILRILILHRENTTAVQFLPCLRVCRNFYKLGHSLFYNTITLTERNLIKFLVTTSQYDQGSAARGLTVRIAGFDGGKERPDSVYWQLDDLFCNLAKLIKKRMRKLSSFSLHFDDQYLEGKGQGDDLVRATPIFRASSVIALLMALPESCTALEIDTSGFERYHGHEHFCPHVAHLLPHLEHLRLRVAQICPGFVKSTYHFTELCPDCPEYMRPPIAVRLRTLVFNMEMSSWVPDTRRCPYSPAIYREPHTIHLEMARFLRCGYVNLNYFPIAERLDIYAKVFVKRSLEWVVRRTSLREFVTYLHGFIPSLPNLDLHASPAQSWRCIRKLDGGDIIAPSARAREILEESWVSTIDGARLPIDHVSKGYSFYKQIYHPRPEEPFFKGNFTMFRSQQNTIRLACSAELSALNWLRTDVLDTVSYRTLNEIPNIEHPWPEGVDMRPLRD